MRARVRGAAGLRARACGHLCAVREHEHRAQDIPPIVRRGKDDVASSHAGVLSMCVTARRRMPRARRVVGADVVCLCVWVCVCVCGGGGGGL